VKRTIVACLALGVALAPPIDGQGQGVSIELRLECLRSGLTQVDTFRFTLANNGAEHMNVVVGQKYSGGSWTPALRLAVKGNAEADAIYGPGALGPLRGAGGFSGRIDDMIVPLPVRTAYVTELKADLFGRLETKQASGLPPSAEITAVLDAQPISHFNSGMEDLRGLKVWTGKLVSRSIRVPIDCSNAKP
jgi:hypothetical protein